MRLLATLSFALGGLVLLVNAAGTGTMTPGLVAIGVAAVAILASRRSTAWATVSLALFAFAAAVGASASESILLPAIALVAALHGWDLALAARRLAGFDRHELRPIVLRYGVSSAAIALGSVALTAAATLFEFRLSFGTLAGLAAGFLLLALAVGIVARPRRRSPTASAVPSDEAE